MILFPQRRENDATEEAGDDEIGRSVPSAAGAEHLKHEQAQLAGQIAPLYSDKGRPGIPTRFAIGVLLKQIYGLSDEGVCERWVYDPYFQYFTGE